MNMETQVLFTGRPITYRLENFLCCLETPNIQNVQNRLLVCVAPLQDPLTRIASVSEATQNKHDHCLEPFDTSLVFDEMTVEMKRPVRRAQRQRRSRQLLQRNERESPGADLRGHEAYMYGHMRGCNIAERNPPDQISGLIQVEEIRRRGSARKQRDIHA
jgi:hypothetical protein